MSPREPRRRSLAGPMEHSSGWRTEEAVGVIGTTHRCTTGEGAHVEVSLRHSQGVEHLRVDGRRLEVDELHLLRDLLQRGFGAQGSDVGTHESMALARYLPEVHV